MEDKLEPPGVGLIELELSLEEISETILLVSLTQWKNVPTTSLQLYLTVLMFNKLPPNVTKNVQEIMLLTVLIKKKPFLLMDFLQLTISNKILPLMDQSLLLSLFMKIYLITNLEFTNIYQEMLWEDTLSKLSVGELITGSSTTLGMIHGVTMEPLESHLENVELTLNVTLEKFDLINIFL